MKLLSSCCLVLAALSASATASAVDWSSSAKAIDPDSDYAMGTVHTLDNAKQSAPSTPSTPEIGWDATPSTATKPLTPLVPKSTPAKTNAGGKPVATPASTSAKTDATSKQPSTTPASSASRAPTKTPLTPVAPTKVPSPASSKTPIASSSSSSSGTKDTSSGSSDTSDNSSAGKPAPANGEYLQPFGTSAPSETLFKRNAGLGKLAPIVNVGPEVLKQHRPIPTNKWWGNLIHTTEKDRTTVANPAWSNPYAIKLPVKDAPYGLQTCYSYSYRKKAELKDDKIKYYLHEYHNDLTLSAQEFTTKPEYEIYDWSDFGASLRICPAGVNGTANSKNKCMSSSVVNGMAFVSATYGGLTPKLVSEYAITKLEARGDDKYTVQLANKQTWVLFTSAALKLTVDSTNKAVVAASGFTGSIRIAVLPENATPTVYDKFAGCTVLSGDVAVASRTQYAFNWMADGASCATNGLLHFAFQHQLDSMGRSSSGDSSSGNATASDTIVLQSTVRGAMTGIVATSDVSTTNASTIAWTLNEPELAQPIDFYPPRKPATAAAAQIKTQLAADIASEWKLAKDGSYYFNGKAYQKYASLCLLAADTSVVGTDTALKTTCLTKLKALIEPFLTNDWNAPLVYETTYRGVVSSQMFAANDVNVEFGNGVYNDHHYHYGYWITASAMLKHLDPTWSRMKELDAIVWTLLRDVANPSADDTFFPTFRHFSWFLGHSYSHGVTPLADGKDQESTSEDINFLYGMMLWGKASKNAAVEDLGSLMLRLDARAIRTYFLMDSANKVHPPEFASNRVTGIFFDNKVDYATWFSPAKYCIHGIQMIPVSPINEIVRTRQFVQDEWTDVLSKEPVVNDPTSKIAWLSLLYVNYATINQAKALERLAVVDMDDGLTRSWALYNAATRATSATK